MFIEKLKYATVVYNQYVESVKLIIQEHYDIPEYENAIFFLDKLYTIYNEFDSSFFTNYDKKIYYFLEHSVYDYDYIIKSYDDNEVYLINKFGITEFWSMDYDCVLGMRVKSELNIPFKYKPVRYTKLIKPNNEIYSTQKLVDCCHIGVITKEAYHRIEFIDKLEQEVRISFNFITQTRNIQDVTHILNCSKYIVDTTRNPNFKTQNQVRIFELLCMGYTVCAEKRAINIFPGLIYEWETLNDLCNIVKKDEYLHPIEAYKKMTYTDEAYEKYVNGLVELWNTQG